MHTETGQGSRTPEAIAAAQARGEPLMRMTPADAPLLKKLGIGASRRKRQGRARRRQQRDLGRALAAINPGGTR